MSRLRKGQDDFSDRLDAFFEELRRRSARLAELRCGTDPELGVERALRDALAELEDQYDELVAVEAELRASADGERARERFDILPVAALETDREGIIRDANRRAQALFGRSTLGAGRLIGKPLPLLVDERDRRAVRGALAGAGEEEASTDLRLSLPMEQPVELFASVCAGGGGRLLWTLHAREGASRDRVAELERKLRDMDEILARERARSERAERADRAKDRFLATLGHDIRGPINAVLAWTSLLQREPFGKDARDRGLAIIETSARHVLALWDELLDVSQLLAGTMHLEVRPLDLAPLVRRVVEGLSRAAEESGVALVFTTSDAGSPVFGDARRLEQIARHLVTNALKFTSRGGRVEVALDRVDAGRVRLRVRDDGDGIAPDRLPRLFETSHPGDGGDGARERAGVGLFIVHRLAMLHEGSVDVASDGLGLGATFDVHLPLREVASSFEPTREVAPPDAAQDLGGLRILVVEDDVDAQEVTTLIFASRGADVASACDAASAIALLSARAFDVLVSDITLPGEDGYTLLRLVRERWPELPVVAVSGHSPAAARDAGFDSVLTKPLGPGELARSVRAVIEGATITTSVSAGRSSPAVRFKWP